MSDDSLFYRVALSIIPGIGSILARNLVAYVGSVEGIFREPVSRLTRIPGIGEVNAHRIREIRKTKFQTLLASQVGSLSSMFQKSSSFSVLVGRIADSCKRLLSKE